MTRERRRVRSLRSLGVAVALAIMLAAGRVHAQADGDEDLVCPLSEEQQNNSKSAWAALFPIFKHDRCSNCHGKLNPFAADLDTERHDRMRIEPSGIGEIDPTVDDAATFDICQSCHEHVAPPGRWKVPPVRPKNQQWWNQDLDELCRTQHKNLTPLQFMGHNTNDHLIQEAFLGTMALNEDAQSVVTPPYPKQSPGTHAAFLQLIRTWLAAQGLDDASPRWQGDKVDCGCLPVHYEIVIDTILFSFPVYPGCDGQSEYNETVPITFTAEDHYTGEGSGTFTVSNLACSNGCTIDYVPAATTVHLEGEVTRTGDGAPDELKINVTRSVQATTFQLDCPCDGDPNCPYPLTVSLPGVEIPTFELGNVPARLGDHVRDGPNFLHAVTIRKKE
jgi:hypothetical protein